MEGRKKNKHIIDLDVWLQYLGGFCFRASSLSSSCHHQDLDHYCRQVEVVPASSSSSSPPLSVLEARMEPEIFLSRYFDHSFSLVHKLKEFVNHGKRVNASSTCWIVLLKGFLTRWHPHYPCNKEVWGSIHVNVVIEPLVSPQLLWLSYYGRACYKV